MNKIMKVLPVLCVGAMILSGCELDGKTSTSTPTVSADVATSAPETTPVTASIADEPSTPETTTKKESTPETTESKEESKPQSANSVVFDDLEITVNPNISLTKLDNQFSDLDGSTVLVVPVTVKNVSDETKGLNPFYVKYFGSKGTELDDLYFYFDDGSKLFNDVRPNADTTSNLYMIYDGDGTYYVSFNSFSEKKEIAIDVSLGE